MLHHYQTCEASSRSTHNSDKPTLYVTPSSYVRLDMDNFLFTAAEACRKLLASVRDCKSLDAFSSGYVKWHPSQLTLDVLQVNNYIVRSYRDVIVVANIVTRITNKA